MKQLTERQSEGGSFVILIATASPPFAVFSRLRPDGHAVPQGHKCNFYPMQRIHPPSWQNPGALRPQAARSDAARAIFIAVHSRKKPQALRLRPK